MAITINSGGNCASDSRGSGRTPCLVDLGLLKGNILVKRGWSIDMTSGVLDEEAYRKLIQEGVLYPYPKPFNFEQNNEDNVIETAPNTGANSIIRSGLPSFTFTYNDGDCYHKGIYDKQGNKNYDVILVFERGLKLVEKNGKLKGFGTNSISVPSYMEKTSESGKSNMVIQLDSAEDYNLNSVALTYANDLGFDASDINGAVDVNLTIGANTATSIPVKVSSICNSSVSVSGLDEVLNWTVINTDTGADIQITSVSESAGGNYTLEGTGFPTTKITVVLNAEDDLEEIYKGKASK